MSAHQQRFYAMTLEEIAKIEGVSRERIRQIEGKALRKLARKGVQSKNLRELGERLAQERAQRLGQLEAA